MATELGISFDTKLLVMTACNVAEPIVVVGVILGRGGVSFIGGFFGSIKAKMMEATPVTKS